MLRAFVRSILLTAFALASPFAFATPQTVNATGLWLRGDESGWGVYVAHQGNTLFATLFVYGPDNQPRWYTASALVGDDGGPQHDHAKVWSGALYESSGTPFYEPFNSASVMRRQVGDMSIEIAGAGGTISYSIDGVRVTKAAQPFTWRMNNVSGGYRAVIVTPATLGTSEVSQSVDLDIRMDMAASTYTMTTASPDGTTCTYSGPATAFNMTVQFAGNFTCSDGRAGPVGFSIDPTPDGFATAGPSPGTRIAATRRGEENYVNNGFMNDLWLAYNGESGWGLNLVGQGDTLFGTLFVYDSTRRAKWYSAPALVLSGGLNNRYWPGRYTGPLYESTGPYYGAASFNANEVTRRQVGSITVEFTGEASATLTYNIDNTSVLKYLMPFAMAVNSLNGSYVGRYWYEPRGVGEDLRISITDGASFTMRTTNSSGRTCTYPTTTANGRSQYGQRVVVSGLYACSDGKKGSFSLIAAEVTYDGFTAQFGIDNDIVGHISGARTSF